jgi:hypothetical protein
LLGADLSAADFLMNRVLDNALIMDPGRPGEAFRFCRGRFAGTDLWGIIMASRQTAFRRAGRMLAAGALLLLAGCGTVLLPGSVDSGPLPPAAPGTARLIFYRSVDYEASQAMPELALNGAPTGRTEAGTMLYRDVAPGTYKITVAPTLPFPNQFPSVTVKPGDVVYIDIGTLANMGDMAPERSYGDTFIVSVVDTETGAFGVYGLRRIHG